MNRREAIKFSVQTSLIATTIGIFLDTTLKSKEILRLRPPGAIDEKNFLKKCIRCGLCVSNCPYDTLHLATLNDNLPNATPYFIPRKQPCYMCIDIPCVPVCPTGALSEKSLIKDKKLDINRAKMGIAVIDTKACIAYWGIQCDACYRACPLIDKAIKISYEQNSNSGKHALLLPIVNNEICTGCGKCEHACITKKASITVLPRDVILGKNDTNYVKSYDIDDEKRLKNSPGFRLKDKSKTLNYLNSKGDL